MRILGVLLIVAFLAGCGASGVQHTVVFSVTALEVGSVGAISYSVGGSAHEVAEADIPWSLSESSPDVGSFSLTVVNAPNPDAVTTDATFSCTVAVDGKVVVTKTGRSKVSCVH